MTKPREDYKPQPGDLVWVDLDPYVGREQGGRRPVLVISEPLFWQETGMVIICPITSKIRPFPSSVVLPPSVTIKGEILTGQVRAIDTRSRIFKFSGLRAPKEITQEVRDKLAVIIGAG